MRVHLTPKSTNAKTGPIPVSTTTNTSCPDACPLKVAGCYAYGQPLRGHWDKVSAGIRGDDWATFIAKVLALPYRQFWRHNQAGDLPGLNNEIDRDALLELARANVGKRGFTYTHKPILEGKGVGRWTRWRNAQSIAMANRRGFTINLSANTLEEADKLLKTGVGPVVVLQDAIEGTRHDTATPEGNAVATCPATYRDDITCATCQLCQRQDRKVIVGFPVHGSQKKAAGAAARG